MLKIILYLTGNLSKTCRVCEGGGKIQIECKYMLTLCVNREHTTSYDPTSANGYLTKGCNPDGVFTMCTLLHPKLRLTCQTKRIHNTVHQITN